MFLYNIGYIGVLLVFVLFVVVFCMIFRGKERKNYFINMLNDRGFLGFFYCLWMVLIFGVFFYILLFGLFLLFDLLSLLGSLVEIYLLRMLVIYGESYRRFNVFFILILGFVILFGVYFYKREVLVRWVFFVLVIFYCVFSVLFLYKFYFVVFMFLIFLIFYFFLSRIIVRLFFILFFILLGLFFVIYVFYIGVDEYDLGDFLIMIFEWVFVFYIVLFDFVLNNFGVEILLLMGVFFLNLKGIFDVEMVYLLNFLMNFIVGKVEGIILVLLVGFLYVNFGVFGVFVNLIIVFIYFLLFNFICERYRILIGFVIWVYFLVLFFNFFV